MSKTENFLTFEEENEIVLAIREAERNTSGEIRVHIESVTTDSNYTRAVEVFNSLKMFNTEKHNAILLYINVGERNFVIYGDKGVDSVVDSNFWELTKQIITSNFKVSNFKKGIIEGVFRVGVELKAHFPYNDLDVDELSNEISKG